MFEVIRSETPIELLSTLLCVSGDCPRTAQDICRSLWARFPSWGALLSAGADQWADIPGVGPVKVGKLQALAQIVRSASAREPVHSSRSAAQLFAHLAGRDQEVVAAAFLRPDHEVVAVKEIFRGTLTDTAAQPREILREALHANAAGLILAHNHVSRQVLPSESDLLFTLRLEWAGQCVGVPLIDHFIIGIDGRSFSFREANLLGKSTPPTFRRRRPRSPARQARLF